MSNRLADERVNAIAQAFFECDMVKSKALQVVGYSKNYAEHNGLKLFDNDRVKAAISKLQAETKARLKGSIEQSVKDYEAAMRLAMKINQPAAAVSAIRWRDGLFGLQTGDKGQEQTVIVISPKQDKRTIVASQEAPESLPEATNE